MKIKLYFKDNHVQWMEWIEKEYYSDIDHELIHVIYHYFPIHLN